MIKVKLNGKVVEADPGTSVLDLARREGLDIPTLCNHEALGPRGDCRLCVVEAEGPVRRRSLTTSCNLSVSEGLMIETDTPLVKTSRRVLIELLLAGSPDSKLLKEMAKRFDVEPIRFGASKSDDCVQCGLCVRVCQDAIGVSAITFSGRGRTRRLTTEFGRLSETCIGCGACANLCPTGAMRVEDKGEERKIFMGNDVIGVFTLLRCMLCGTAYATEKFLNHVVRRSEGITEANIAQGFCPACARRHSAEVYKELYFLYTNHNTRKY